LYSLQSMKKDFPLTNDLTLRVEFSRDKVARLAEEEVDFRVKVKLISMRHHGQLELAQEQIKQSVLKCFSLRKPQDLVELQILEENIEREDDEVSIKIPRSLLKTISSEMYGRVSEKAAKLKLTQLESLTLDETFKLLQFLSSYQVKSWMPAMVQLLNMQFSCSTPTVILPFFLT
jgi:hypothetical protein